MSKCLLIVSVISLVLLVCMLNLKSLNQNDPLDIHVNQLYFDGSVFATKPRENVPYMKVAHFSDLHLKNSQSTEQATRVVELLNEYAPDLICFTGDFMDASDIYTGDTTELVALFNTLTPQFGKYAVLGNHDITKRMNGKADSLLSECGFTLLTNQTLTIERDDTLLTVTGLTSAFNTDYMTGSLDQLTFDTFNLLLVHEPDTIVEFISQPINLQLSGHTHGGQVRIDDKPLITTPMGKLYTEGTHLVDEIPLNVNTGIGYSRLDIRVNCPPTIDIIYIPTHLLEK